VMGVAAMVKPLRIEALIVSRELPIMLLATLSALIIGMDRIRGESEFYDRSDGLLLLLFFCVFLYQSTVGSESEPSDEPLRAEVSEQARTRTRNSVLRPGLTGAIGLGTLLLGAELTVMSAVSLAELMEVPPAIIGLTIVAVGTSLPELVTSVVATWRGQTDLAVANVVGSNIFNLLFILGSTAVMRPILVPVPGGGFDLLVLCGVSAVVLLLSRTGSSTVVRWHGATLLVAYLVYVTFRIAA